MLEIKRLHTSIYLLYLAYTKSNLYNISDINT